MNARAAFLSISLAAVLGFAAGVGVTHDWNGARATLNPGPSLTETLADPGTPAFTRAERLAASRAQGPLSTASAADKPAVMTRQSARDPDGVELEAMIDRARTDPDTREALFRSFLSTSGDERGLWLSALRRLKGDDVKRFAIDSLNDSDPSVRMASYQMLQDYAPNDADLQSTLVRQVSVEREPAAQLVLLKSLSPAQLATGERQAARQALESLAGEADPEVRAAALGLLTGRYLEGVDRTQWLGIGLEDPDARVRTSALASLWTVGNGNIQHWDRIRDIATDPHESWAVRDAALALIERDGSPYAGDGWVAGARGVVDNQFANSENATN